MSAIVGEQNIEEKSDLKKRLFQITFLDSFEG